LVVEEYIQTYHVDYLNSLVACLYYVWVLLVEVVKQWTLYQLDIKNDFLHGDLQ